jgi:excisionase family DNA binding protein
MEPVTRRPSDRRYLTSAEAADLLGVSRWTIRRAASRGEIPAFRLGPRGLYRIDRLALERLISMPVSESSESS